MTAQDPVPGAARAALSVVVPVFNEETTVATVLTRLRHVPGLKEVIVVDDGSTDATVAVVERLECPHVRLIRQARNQGKTAAVRRGLQEVTGDITIFQDADLEYDPQEIADVVRPILEGRADVVYGSRFLVRHASRVLYFYHYVGNKALTLLSNLLTNVNMTDIETCYKAFRTPLIKSLPLTSRGFGMEVEITALITKTRARIYEVPISYYGRTYEEGKKIRAVDGLAALWYIVYCNLVASRTAAGRSYVRAANAYLEGMRRGRPVEGVPGGAAPAVGE